MQDDIEKAWRPFKAKIAEWFTPDVDGYIIPKDGLQRIFALGYKAHAARSGWCYDMDKAPQDGTQIFLNIHGLSEGTVVARWCDRVGAWDTSAGMAEPHHSIEWLHVAHELTCWMFPPQLKGGE